MMSKFRAQLASHPAFHGLGSGHLLALGAAVIATSAAVTTVSPTLLLAVFVAGILFLLALRDLSIGVLAIVASVPIQATATLVFGDGSLTWTQLAVLATLTAWAVRIVGGVSCPRLDALGTALFAYVIVLALSIVEATNVSAWAGEVYRWSVALVVYLIAIETIRGVRDAKRVIVITASAVFILAAYAVWQVVTGAGPETFTVGGVTRAFGTFGEPNPFAGYLEMTVLLLVALVIGSLESGRGAQRQRPLTGKLLIWVSIAAITGTGALIVTQSRGGYLGFAAGLGVAVWLTGGRVRLLGTVGGAIALVALLLSPFGSKVTDRFRAETFATDGTQVTTDNFASQERFAHWQAAINMARESPLLGVGAGNYDDHFRDSTAVWRFRIPRGHAHNAYLHALAQAGLLGLLAYLSLLAVVAAKVIRTLNRATDPFGRAVTIGVVAVSVAVAVHNMVEYLHVLSLGLQLSVAWALLSVVRTGETSAVTT